MLPAKEVALPATAGYNPDARSMDVASYAARLGRCRMLMHRSLGDRSRFWLTHSAESAGEAWNRDEG